MGSLNQINHVVVLMLENRSFDNLLGPHVAGLGGQLGAAGGGPDPLRENARHFIKQRLNQLFQTL